MINAKIVYYLRQLNLNSKQQMESNINSFKQEIENMFQKTFQELSQKNNLNKAILSNLMEAATDQSRRISQMDDNLEHLKNTAVPQIGNIKYQINSQQKQIHDNFDNMMFRLNQIQEGINQSRVSAEKNLQINQQSQQSMNQLLKQLQKMQRQEGSQPYHGNRDQLLKEVEQFEKILDQQNQHMRGLDTNIEMNKKTTTQPIKTFQTKIAMHNRNNQEILKEKLRGFSEKLKRVEKKIDEAAWTMSNENNKTKIQEKRINQQMGMVQKQMMKLRVDLENADMKRKQQIQSNAATLDNMVEQMLVETKKLEVRVDNLRKGFEQQAEKLKQK